MIGIYIGISFGGCTASLFGFLTKQNTSLKRRNKKNTESK
jgi:hypothetical protein